MTATFQLQESTVEYIKELVEESYFDGDIYEFIDIHGEDNFVKYYEEYVKNGESNSYEAVDAFVEEFGLDNLEYFDDAYQGMWDTFEDFAENLFDNVYAHNIPEHLQSYIDYDAFANDLKYDYLINNDYVFNRNF